MRIAVDVDDVIIDLLPVWLERYNQDYDDFLSPEDIHDWDLVKFVKPACGEKIYDYLDQPDLYDTAGIIPIAIAMTTNLKEAGHKLFYVTIRHHDGKLKLLRDNGFVDEKGTEYVVIADKSMLDVDILIDDMPRMITEFSATGRPAILFSHPHNRNFKWNWWVTSWMEIPGILKQFEKVVPGVGTDAPTAINEHGGKQSALDYRFDLIDPLVLFNLAKILYEGAEKYGEWNWRRLSVTENLNHALSHIFAYMAEDPQDDHIGHAFCRLMFVQSLLLTPGQTSRMTPKDV